MQHSAQHTLHYNVAAPPCVQVDACGGRGPANLHLQPGGGAHPGSKVARQHHSALALLHAGSSKPSVQVRGGASKSRKMTDKKTPEESTERSNLRTIVVRT